MLNCCERFCFVPEMMKGMKRVDPESLQDVVIEKHLFSAIFLPLSAIIYYCPFACSIVPN